MKRIPRIRIFFKVWVPPSGVVDIWWVKIPKGTPLEHTLSIDILVGCKTFQQALSAYTFVMCKIKAHYLLTYLFT